MQVSMYAAYVYDATMLYALTVDKMIKSKADYNNGQDVLQFAQQIVFKGQF